MLTEKQIDDQFSDLDKYLRWLINTGLWDTWDIMMIVLRADHHYILRRKIK